jgi:hypothetical protein
MFKGLKRKICQKAVRNSEILSSGLVIFILFDRKTPDGTCFEQSGRKQKLLNRKQNNYDTGKIRPQAF